ncbi:hypothetical protein [Psychrobacter sp. ANT_H59]|uniref:hypothetical protein n=1 Tax=Psychrobacter sp. ANT_H59 TaxID=2597354 RepID=UPI0011ED6745|nr:hypothetical protein [Psychrobacter sp. ANT_H59]KAA0939039.1 hypothetical protein FQ083_04600 [Psychrobacter sp. ANT_H59]
MKNHTLALSLLIGAALTVPTLAMAAPADTKAAKKTTATAEMAVEAKVESTGNETDANTSKTSKMTPFAIRETQTISRARVNSNIGQQPITTEIKAPNGQQPMTTEIKAPAEALQNSELQTTEIISEDVVLDAEEDLAEVSEEDDL